MDDDDVEAILTGRPVAGADTALSSLVHDVLVAASGPVPLSPQLARAIAGGFSTEKGDLSARAASNADGPATQVAGLPKWRKIRMNIAQFLAGLTMTAKVGLGVGVAAAGVAGAGATGVLPLPGDDRGVAVVVDAPGPVPAPGDTTAPSAATGDEAPAPVAGDAAAPATAAPDPAPTEAPTAPDAAPTKAPVAAPAPTKPSSEAPKPTTKPAPAPTGFTVSCAPSAAPDVTCTWSGVPAGSTGIALYRSGPDGSRFVLETADVDKTAFRDTAVTKGATYSYKVKAFRPEGGYTGSNVVEVTVPGAPAQPKPTVPEPVYVQLSCGMSGDAVRCEWGALPADAAKVTLHRTAADGSSSFVLETHDVSKRSFLDLGVEGGTWYGYRLKVLRADGNYAAKSDTVKVTTPPPATTAPPTTAPPATPPTTTA